MTALPFLGVALGKMGLNARHQLAQSRNGWPDLLPRPVDIQQRPGPQRSNVPNPVTATHDHADLVIDTFYRPARAPIVEIGQDAVPMSLQHGNEWLPI